jgi:AcrR family transcriptional regulator
MAQRRRNSSAAVVKDTQLSAGGEVSALSEESSIVPKRRGRPLSGSGGAMESANRAAKGAPGKGKWDRSQSTEERHDVVRRRLIDGAKLALQEVGVGGFSVDLVADAAHISRQTFYVHFDGRPAILLAVHQEMARDLFGGFDAAVRSGASAVDAVCSALGNVLDYVVARPNDARFVLVEGPALGGRHAPLVRTYFDALASMLVLGSLRSGNGSSLSMESARALVHGLRGLAVDALHDGSVALLPAMLADYRALVIRAIGADGTRRHDEP